MVGENSSGSSRALRILKTSITDSEVLRAIVPTDMKNLGEGAKKELSASDVRMCIITCFDRGKEEAGLVLANTLIEYAEELYLEGNDGRLDKILGAVVGALAYASDSHQGARDRILRLLGHPEPLLLSIIVENLPTTSKAENFSEVCKLLVHPDFHVRITAMEYAEKSISGAAFSGGNARKEEPVDEFMRKALVPLEAAYEEIKTHPESAHIRKRLSILVAMAYNEILDAIDVKCEMGAERKTADMIYFAWEQHLNKDIAPEAIPSICKMLDHQKNPDERVEICALNTLGRISNSGEHAEKIMKWVRSYLGKSPSELHINVAREILDAKIEGKRFASIPPVDKGRLVGSIIPPPARRK